MGTFTINNREGGQGGIIYPPLSVRLLGQYKRTGRTLVRLEGNNDNLYFELSI